MKLKYKFFNWLTDGKITITDVPYKEGDYPNYRKVLEKDGNVFLKKKDSNNEM